MPVFITHDRRANHVPADYYTSLAVFRWVDAEMQRSIPPLKHTTTRSLECASHNRSCSAPPIPPDEWSNPRAFFDSAHSTITIGGRFWDLPAPLLSVGLKTFVPDPDWLNEDFEGRHPKKASDFWSDTSASTSIGATSQDDESLGFNGSWYMYNETLLTKAIVINNGRCIADEAYSWGFSSLLLLTFCCYTAAFALALTLLQTDIYWNSRHDRDLQSYSIYTDVLYLAEELKATFGYEVGKHMQSPKAFDEKVGNWEQGLCLDVRELPLSRWQEWRLFQATKRADRKGKITEVESNDAALELRNISFRNHKGFAGSDTAYDGLIGGDSAKPDFVVVSRLDRRSTSGELAPSLAGTQTSMEASVRGTPILEDTGSECSYLGGNVPGSVVHEERASQIRLSRRG
jgi:hypothetical protein